ncbi:hypothetical protein [Clostridium sp. KNHs216]|uniref:hypothetical protein n=1 Tax=Clostridium sp. KNHs216 TaxID=1550235 RepID=UPI00114E08A2|nr:hypothetical protein [Clostridium sp. KNHs216]
MRFFIKGSKPDDRERVGTYFIRCGSGFGFAVDLRKAKNLIEYVGKRPGVDRIGEHGLFSSEPNVDIRKAQEEVASCKGNIWTHVISLRREDADALGYDHQKPSRDLILQKVDVIAKA